jgi:hypothetical protein
VSRKPDFGHRRTGYGEDVRMLSQERLAMAKGATRITKEKKETKPEAGKKKKAAPASLTSAAVSTHKA